MKTFDYDLLVVGAGSGGIRAARASAKLGARVGIAENASLGGTCVNAGCVPKKLFFYAAHFSDDFTSAKGFGWSVNNKEFNWEKLIINKNMEISRLNNLYEKLLHDAGIKLIKGHAILNSPHSITVGEQSYSAKRILLATGGQPYIPDIPGRQHIISSSEVFSLKTLPEKIIIVGGGYIAVEFAGIFNGLGVDTTLIHRDKLFLRGFDQDIRNFLAIEMDKKGIKLRFETEVKELKKNNQKLRATLSDESILSAGQILYATGRKPRTRDMGIENIGVKTDDNGAVIIDETYQTNIPTIYAIGDITNRINLTPVALAEGSYIARLFYDSKNLTRVDYRNIPTCIFSQPNVSSVGLSEQAAKKKYAKIDVYRTSFTPMKHALSGINEKAYLKLIVEQETDKVIGAHMVGSDAGEIIQGISIAIKAGARKADFDNTIGIHPTIAEEFTSME